MMIVRTMSAAVLLLAVAAYDAEAARPCRSYTPEQATALEFCEQELKCSEKSPPQEISCPQKPGRWICTCKKPKPATGGQDRQSESGDE